LRECKCLGVCLDCRIIRIGALCSIACQAEVRASARVIARLGVMVRERRVILRTQGLDRLSDLPVHAPPADAADAITKRCDHKGVSKTEDFLSLRTPGHILNLHDQLRALCVVQRVYQHALGHTGGTLEGVERELTSRHRAKAEHVLRCGRQLGDARLHHQAHALRQRLTAQSARKFPTAVRATQRPFLDQGLADLLDVEEVPLRLMIDLVDERWRNLLLEHYVQQVPSVVAIERFQSYARSQTLAREVQHEVPDARRFAQLRLPECEDN